MEQFDVDLVAYRAEARDIAVHVDRPGLRVDADAESGGLDVAALDALDAGDVHDAAVALRHHRR